MESLVHFNVTLCADIEEGTCRSIFIVQDHMEMDIRIPDVMPRVPYEVIIKPMFAENQIYRDCVPFREGIVGFEPDPAQGSLLATFRMAFFLLESLPVQRGIARLRATMASSVAVSCHVFPLINAHPSNVQCLITE